jgi:cytochrome c
MMMRVRIILLAAAMLLACALGLATERASAQTPQKLRANAARGMALYEQRCAACHSIDANRIGPKHRGVVGRRSGSVPNFTYTAALRRLNVTWSEANLDRWLANPTAMAPGTAMGFRVSTAQDRADIIAYLRTQR